jgi:hypothetical protein
VQANRNIKQVNKMIMEEGKEIAYEQAKKA